MRSAPGRGPTGWEWGGEGTGFRGKPGSETRRLRGAREWYFRTAIIVLRKTGRLLFVS